MWAINSKWEDVLIFGPVALVSFASLRFAGESLREEV